MIKLRTILLHNYPYYIILLISILTSLIYLALPKNSIYKTSSKEAIGIVTNYNVLGNKLSITLKGKEKLLINYYFGNKKEKNKITNNIHLGDLIKVTGTFKSPKSQTSKYLFDYKNYLYHKKIYFIVESNSIKTIKYNKNLFYKVKQFIFNRLNNDAYLNTFILGDKSYLKTEEINSYQENGLSHLFAISGMHISLFSAIILKLLKFLRIKEKPRFYITSAILLIYMSLTNQTPSIIRGVLFFILFSINQVYYFNIKPTNLFILALSLTILLNPNYLHDIGFFYSFSISLSLIILNEYLTKNKNYFISLLKTSIISFIISMPISLYNFHQINLLSIIYNLFFVPFVSIIVFPLSLLTVIIKNLSPIYTIFTTILKTTSIFLSKITILKFTFPHLHIFIYILYYVLIIALIKMKKKKYLIMLFLLIIFHYFYPNIIRKNYIKMIDVGQGDSILIHSNNETVLIDTGGIMKYQQEKFEKSPKESSIVKTTTIPLLKSLGIRKINHLILTHGDYDHMGEAINLVENFKVEKVILNCGSYNNLENELIKVLDNRKIEHYSCINELNIDNNKLYFLNTKEYDNENDNSSVIYTKLNNYKFLFMGDASSVTEKEILNKYNISNIDVLKVGHHGSNTSSSQNFIDKMDPEYSLISVGKNNRYGHPNKEVLETLSNSKIYRTDINGSIEIKLNKNGYKIRTCSQ